MRRPRRFKERPWCGMSYNRMNPQLPELLNRLFSYKKKDYTTEAYPLSRAEAEILFTTITKQQDELAAITKERDELNNKLSDLFKLSIETTKVQSEKIDRLESELVKLKP
jgi:peptidoglycan hydrolase CwlO-like protein